MFSFFPLWCQCLFNSARFSSLCHWKHVWFFFHDQASQLLQLGDVEIWEPPACFAKFLLISEPSRVGQQGHGGCGKVPWLVIFLSNLEPGQHLGEFLHQPGVSRLEIGVLEQQIVRHPFHACYEILVVG